VHQAERKAVAFALAIAVHTTEEGPLTDQVTLPLRHGGLGLSRISPALGRAAYLAASAAAHIVMRSGPEAFRPFDGHIGKVLRPQWEALHSEAGDLWKPELKEVNPERLGHIAEAQGVLHGTRPKPVLTRSTMPTACKAGARTRACSAAPAAPHRPGSTLSPALRLLNSRAGKSAPASATASTCFPPTPLPCNSTVAPPFAPPRLTTECGAHPSLHIPRCAMTS
jgi:hypothetical protein